MALVVADRVKETSTTAGTGTLTLAGASAGFQSFAVIGDGNTTYYTIVDGTANTWEVGIGTYTASGTTLSRGTVLSNSSGTTTQINFAGNSKDVFVTMPAERIISGVGGGVGAIVINSTTVTENALIDTGTNGLSIGPLTTAPGKSVTIASGQRHVII
jgi:hypothetical protein